MGYSPKKIVPRMKDYEDDGSWMWVAFAPDCRLIVAFVIGPRKQYVADELLELTAKCLSESIPLFVSDGLKFYKYFSVLIIINFLLHNYYYRVPKIVHF